MVKGSMQQKDLIILKDPQRDLDSQTIIVGGFNTPLSIPDRSSRQKINKDIQDFNSDLDQVDLIKSTELSNPSPQNIHSSQHHIALILQLTT